MSLHGGQPIATVHLVESDMAGTGRAIKVFAVQVKLTPAPKWAPSPPGAIGVVELADESVLWSVILTDAQAETLETAIRAARRAVATGKR